MKSGTRIGARSLFRLALLQYRRVSTFTLHNKALVAVRHTGRRKIGIVCVIIRRGEKRARGVVVLNDINLQRRIRDRGDGCVGAPDVVPLVTVQFEPGALSNFWRSPALI